MLPPPTPVELLADTQRRELALVDAGLVGPLIAVPPTPAGWDLADPATHPADFAATLIPYFRGVLDGYTTRLARAERETVALATRHAAPQLALLGVDQPHQPTGVPPGLGCTIMGTAFPVVVGGWPEEVVGGVVGRVGRLVAAGAAGAAGARPGGPARGPAGGVVGGVAVAAAWSALVVRAVRLGWWVTARAYRAALAGTYAAAGVGWWVWAAAVGGCCVVCLLQHGTVMGREVAMVGHPGCRCLPVPSLGDRRGVVPGRAVLARLDKAGQVARLGLAAWAAWTSGVITPESLVGWHEDPEWGPSRYRRSIREARAASTAPVAG